MGLGCLSFGGPIAHLGYLRAELVEKRRWLDDAHYGDLVALCQFLPGPASSQVVFALGMQRAGLLGALVASACFTLPSALIMLGFAYGVAGAGDLEGAGWLHGLKLAAVAVVLPLLRAELVPRGWLTHDQFLAGYGLAQALPGPLDVLGDGPPLWPARA